MGVVVGCAVQLEQSAAGKLRARARPPHQQTSKPSNNQHQAKQALTLEHVAPALSHVHHHGVGPRQAGADAGCAARSTARRRASTAVTAGARVACQHGAAAAAQHAALAARQA